MKKLLIVLVVVCAALAAAYVGASYWMGVQAQQNYERILSLKTVPPYIVFTTDSYDRGIFESSARTTVSFKHPAEDQGNRELIRFTLVNHLQHGPLAVLRTKRFSRPFEPVMAIITTRLAPAAQNSETLAWVLGQFPELGESESVAVLKFDGSGESFLDIPAFQKRITQDKNGDLVLDWGGFTSNSRFDLSLENITADFSAPRLIAEDQAGRFVLRNLKADFTSKMSPKGLTLGSVNFGCDSVQFNSKEDETSLVLESSALKADSTESGDAVSGSLVTRFEKLAVNGDIFGPFVFDFELRKLDAPALAQFEKDMLEVRNQVATKSPEELKTILTSLYTKLLTALIAKSPQLEIKQLKMGTSRGELSASLRIDISPTAASILENPLPALSALSAKLDFSIAEPLLFNLFERVIASDLDGREDVNPGQVRRMAEDKYKEILPGLLEQKIVVRESGKIKSSASFAAGVLIINGRKLGLADLLKDE